jgi:hypothetical protein
MPSINGLRFGASLKTGTTTEISGGKGVFTTTSPSECSNPGIQECRKIEYDVTKKYGHKIPVTVIVHQHVPFEDP